MTSTQMTNFQGVPAEKVAEVIVKTVTKEIKADSLEDVDVSDYV